MPKFHLIYPADIHAVGIDIHQKVIVGKEIDLSMTHDCGSMHSFTSQPKDICIIPDNDKSSSQSRSIGGPRNPNESKWASDNM